jgi:hypothetical protein
MSDVSAFFIKNHKASELLSLPVGELVALPPRPETFPTKKEFLAWSQNSDTEHCFYSGWAPRDSSQRLTRDNPAAFLHLIVADYDVHNLEQSAVDRAIKDCPLEYPVAYVSRTFSGGLRMVWVLERPLAVFNDGIAKLIIARITRELKLRKLAPGLDETALANPAQYFELGTDWKAVCPERSISSAHLTAWEFEASQKFNWKKEGGSAIPIDVVAAEVERKWPGVWQGSFAIGSQGVRFWVPGADAPKGAWIRETGIQDFVEGRFIHWAGILGQDFVKSFDTKRISDAVGDIWYSDRTYWQKNSEKNWDKYAPECVRRHFLIKGLRPEAQPGGSEIDRAFHFVDYSRKIDGCFPFLYDDRDIVPVSGNRFLNISRVRPVQPLPGTRFWSEGFPWLAAYLDGLFDAEQLEVFLSWLSRAYQGALDHHPRQGHGVFVVGPKGVGKTLLGSKVVGDLLGGSSDAAKVLTGKENFNGDLFHKPVWRVDDGQIPPDRQSHETWSLLIKNVVANPDQTYRRMYADGVTLPWSGRLFVTLNHNAISTLPNIEAELLDKVIFLKAKAPGVSFSDPEAAIARELPHLASFLRDFVIPEKLKDEHSDRFGFGAYHHQELLDEAKADSPSSDIGEIVNQWRTSYFRSNDKDPDWSGTALEFQQELNACDSLTQIVKQTIRGSRHLASALTMLSHQGTPWICKRKTGGQQKYFILRPGSQGFAVADVPDAGNQTFFDFIGAEGTERAA